MFCICISIILDKAFDYDYVWGFCSEVFQISAHDEGGHTAQYQKLSSSQHYLHPVRHASTVTVQSQHVDMACVIRISHHKAVGDVSTLKRRLISARMDFAMFDFSFEFHPIFWFFDKQNNL